MVRRLGLGCLGLLVALVVIILVVPWAKLSVDVPRPGPAVAPSAATPDAYRPSFAVLPSGRWTPGRELTLFDPSGVDADSLALSGALDRADFPPHRCRLVAAESMTVQQFEQDAERYANCLLDAWRPWLASHRAVEPPRVSVRHCARRDMAGERGCRDPDNFLGRAGSREIHLAPTALPGKRSRVILELVLAHEAAHVLQFHVRPVAGGEHVLTMGVAEPDEQRMSRRTELQADCMATAMVSADGKHPGLAREAADDAYPSDREHWDLTSHRFWNLQAGRNRVGECRAVVAAERLVAWSGPGR